MAASSSNDAKLIVERTPGTIVTTLHPHDVLFGRNLPAPYCSHPGRVFYRGVIDDHVWDYFVSKRSFKSVYHSGIVMREIAARDPAGRYLDPAPRSGGTASGGKKQAWVVLSETEASKRIKECLKKTAARYKKRYPDRVSELLEKKNREENNGNSNGGGSNASASTSKPTSDPSA